MLAMLGHVLPTSISNDGLLGELEALTQPIVTTRGI